MTRHILRILGSRYGIAAILVVLVITVVALAQANTDPPPPNNRQQDGSVDTVSPGAPDDGYAEPDTDPADGATPGPTPASFPVEAIDTATQFANLWADADGVTEQEWYDRLVPYSTTSTQESLSGVDPANVPATEITGEPVPAHPYIEFDTDQGLLILLMMEENGQWKVAGVDFRHF